MKFQNKGAVLVQTAPLSISQPRNQNQSIEPVHTVIMPRGEIMFWHFIRTSNLHRGSIVSGGCQLVTFCQNVKLNRTNGDRTAQFYCNMHRLYYDILLYIILLQHAHVFVWKHCTVRLRLPILKIDYSVLKIDCFRGPEEGRGERITPPINSKILRDFKTIIVPKRETIFLQMYI